MISPGELLAHLTSRLGDTADGQGRGTRQPFHRVAFVPVPDAVIEYVNDRRQRLFLIDHHYRPADELIVERLFFRTRRLHLAVKQRIVQFVSP